MSKEFDEKAAQWRGKQMACKYSAPKGGDLLVEVQTNSFIKGARWMFSQCRDDIDDLKNEIDRLQQYNDAAVLTQERDKLLEAHQRYELGSYQKDVDWYDEKLSLCIEALKQIREASTKGDETTTELECHAIADDAIKAIGDKVGE